MLCKHVELKHSCFLKISDRTHKNLQICLQERLVKNIKKNIPAVCIVFTSHKKETRHSCECHIEVFHITSSPTQTHLPPSHHDPARQLATVSFSAITHEGSHANHSRTQVLSSWLLRAPVVNSPADVSGSWVLEHTGVMLMCLMLLWHTAVKLSPQDKGWHRDGQQFPVSVCFPPYPYSRTGQQLAVKF